MKHQWTITIAVSSLAALALGSAPALAQSSQMGPGTGNLPAGSATIDPNATVGSGRQNSSTSQNNDVNNPNASPSTSEATAGANSNDNSSTNTNINDNTNQNYNAGTAGAGTAPRSDSDTSGHGKDDRYCSDCPSSPSASPSGMDRDKAKDEPKNGQGTDLDRAGKAADERDRRARDNDREQGTR